jgi:hypothetical protein
MPEFIAGSPIWGGPPASIMMIWRMWPRCAAAAVAMSSLLLLVLPAAAAAAATLQVLLQGLPGGALEVAQGAVQNYCQRSSSGGCCSAVEAPRLGAWAAPEVLHHCCYRSWPWAQAQARMQGRRSSEGPDNAQAVRLG